MQRLTKEVSPVNRTAPSIFSFLLILLCLWLFSGCGNQDQSSMQLSSKARLAPVAEKTDLSALVSGNNQFAFEMYKRLGQTETGNLFFSPYSLSQSLATVYAGARGETATQIAAALHFSQPQETLHAGFNSLAQGFSSSPATFLSKPDFELTIANALWGQEDYKFSPEFLDVLMQYYGTGVHTTDFNNPNQALNAINQWANNATNGKIDHALSEIPPDTKFILANAVYFNAKWNEPFSSEGNDEFHSLTGEITSVPMMKNSYNKDLPYTKEPDYELAVVPYWENRAEMVILLPAEGKFNEIEAKLTNDWIQDKLTKNETTLHILIMPKFRLEPSEAGLKFGPILSALGMVDAFSKDNADFSGMDGTRSLVIKEILQKAYIQVDEKGTEASVFSGVFGVINAALYPVTMKIDRPFIFFIRDTQTGTILFLGRVTSLP
jgi:serpin B